MTGVLSKLPRLVTFAAEVGRNKGVPTEAIERLGQSYRAAAKATPRYFESGVTTPARTWKEANARYGTNTRIIGAGESKPQGLLEVSHGKHPAQIQPVSHASSHMPDIDYLLALSDMMGKDAYLLNATDLAKGAGAAKRIYPAVFDVQGSAGKLNVADAVSLDNKARRSFQMADSNLKFGDSGHTLIGPKQLSVLGTTPEQFWAASPDAQLGLLLTDGALQARNQLQPADWLFEDVAQQTGINPNSALADWKRYGQAVYDRTKGLNVSAGDTTFRRLHAIDQLSQGAQPPLTLLQGLNYRAGGLV